MFSTTLPTCTQLCITILAACALFGAAQPDCNVNVSAVANNTIATAAMVNGILKAHNDARNSTTPGAVNMPPLQWSDDLAAGAQAYLDGCPGFQHSTQALRTDRYGFAYVGENLAAGMRFEFNGFVVASGLWIDERQVWTYGGATCSNAAVCGSCAPTSTITSCGHYTQVVWANSLFIGCGYKKCGTLEIYNCWYGPGGNIRGQGPFVDGARNMSQTCPRGAANSSGPGGPAPPPSSVGSPSPNPSSPLNPSSTPNPSPPNPSSTHNPSSSPNPSSTSSPASGSAAAALADDTGGASTGTIVGIAAGVGAAVGILAAGAFIIVRRRQETSTRMADVKSDVEEMMMQAPPGDSERHATLIAVAL
jgi:hypothetical protein